MYNNKKLIKQTSKNFIDINFEKKKKKINSLVLINEIELSDIHIDVFFK